MVKSKEKNQGMGRDQKEVQEVSADLVGFRGERRMSELEQMWMKLLNERSEERIALSPSPEPPDPSLPPLFNQDQAAPDAQAVAVRQTVRHGR